MKIFEFTIVIDQYVEDLDKIDAFYGKTGDATVAGSAATCACFPIRGPRPTRRPLAPPTRSQTRRPPTAARGISL